MKSSQHHEKPRSCGAAITAAETPRPHYELRTTNYEPPPGLSLIEVLITLVVLAIALSLAVISIKDWSVHSNLDGAAKRIVQALRFAQGQAMVTGDDAAVEFDTGADSLRCVRSVGSPPYADLSDPLTKRPYVVQLVAATGSGVDLSSVSFGGDTDVTFNKDGAPDEGGTVVLTYRGVTRTITVSPVSGRIAVQ